MKVSFRNCVGAMALAVASLGAGAALAADYTMKLSFGQAAPTADYVTHGATPLQAFADEVNEKSGGRIEAQVFWNGQLGKDTAVANLVRGGNVEGMLASDGVIAPFFPDIQVLGLPYLFIDRKVAFSVFDDGFGDYLSDRMAAEAGLRVIAWLENGGYRNYTSNKPLESAADLEGQKIRTMTNPLHMGIVESLGASPTPIPFADLYTSLQTGVVDGEENSVLVFRDGRLNEVQKHMILDGHVYSVITLMVSEEWFQSLPDDLKQVVLTAGENMEEMNRRISAENEARDLAFIQENGTSVFDPGNEGRAVFRDKTQGPALELISKEVSPEVLEKLQAAVGEAESKL